jgi:hypothetical protein
MFSQYPRNHRSGVEGRMSDDLPLNLRTDAQIIAALKLETRGLKKAIAAIDAAAEAVDRAVETGGANSKATKPFPVKR